jgi:site-specific DNA-methyltransferase (adenine-specific)
MKSLPDKSIDLFICDLPYNQLACSWDIKIDLVEFWKQIERLMKNDHTPIIHFCNTRFGYELMKSKEDWFRYDLVWEKTNAVGFLLANKQPLRSHENIYVFAKKGANYYRIDIEGDFKFAGGGRNSNQAVYGNDYKNIQPDNEGKRCVKSVFQFANKKGKGNHPTQKPLDLYKFLIDRYSKEGDTILDPTAGSFASGLACRELHREYIGIEMDEGFYKKGVDMLQ